MATKPKYCVDCGQPGPFPTARSTKCVDCRRRTDEDHDAYLLRYNRLKYRAMAALAKKHPKEYRELLEAEHRRAKREERKNGNGKKNGRRNGR